MKGGVPLAIGSIVLFITAVIIYFGLAERVLDRLYLTDNQALIIITLIIAGSYINIPLYEQPFISINVGGFVIPLLLSLYILFKSDTNLEKMRALLAAVLTGTVIYGLSIIFKNYGHGRDLIEPFYLFALTGGLIAYLAGRSRRGAFFAGVVGFIIYQLTYLVNIIQGDYIGDIRLGAAGAFDTILISGIFSLLLVELIGETREYVSSRGENK